MYRIFKTAGFALLVSASLIGCGKDSGDSAPTPPPAPKQAPADVSAAPVAAPEAPAPVPPPGPGQSVVAPSAPAEPPSDSDILGGNGRPLTEQEKIVLNYGLDMFKNEKGRYPKDLAEAVASRHITRLPKLPPGEELSYDPATGKVTVVKK
jgi:hypothetical protein